MASLIGISEEVLGIEVNVEQVLTIGRHSDNDVCINDAAASRHHCRIEREGPMWSLIDNESSNGTWVNNQAVERKQQLSDKDRIRVGNSVFFFRTQTAAPKPVGLMVDSWAAHSTAVMSSNQVRRMTSEVLMGAPPVGEHANRSMHTFLAVGKLLRSCGSVSSLQEELFTLIADVVPAEGGAILLVGYGDREPEVSYVWNRHATGSVSMSRTVVQRVIREGVAVLANDSSAEEINAVESLAMRGILSVMCVPLVVQDVVHGAIYVETTDPVKPFAYSDLEMVTAISGYAALAFDNARRMELLEKENARLRSQADLRHAMVGDSPAMREFCERMRKVAQTDATVLITGESGTGKELTARALHMNSRRLSGPFESMNCALLRDNLLESELFGHEKGSFTGAVSQKRGRLELADGGTVFLDEVGDLPDKPQAMLLRVLQEREFLRVGGTRLIRVDIRLIAATNKDLEQAIRDKEFRQDLFYRLSVICLRLPPLRDRREDIPLLAHHFVQRSAKRNKKPISRVSPPAMALLMRYGWPGNIRELENVVEYAVVFASSDEVLPEDLPDSVHEAAEHGNSVSNYNAAVKQAREQIVLNAIRQANYDYSTAAALLGIHVNNLHRLLRELNLKSRIPRP